MTIKFFRSKLLCATMLMGAATPGHSQAAVNEEPTDPNDIVVTGTRRSTTLQDAPINISVVGSRELAKQRIDDIKSLSAFTPGVTVIDTGPNSTGNIILRGISSADTSGTSNYQSALGVYLGEVPLYLDLKLLDIGRVEVLQGPQGTLYGLGTLSGAVRYIPNRPNLDQVTLDVHARTFDQSQSKNPGVNGDATVNFPIIKDHVALRSTIGYYNNPGFIDYNYLLQKPGVSNPQPVKGATAAEGSFGTPADYAANFYSKKDLNFEHTFTTRNQLLLEPNPDLRLYLTYAHQETKTGGRQANGAGVLGTGRYEAPWRYREPTDRKADLFASEFNIGFGFAQLVATAAWTNQKIDAQSDNTDLLLDLDYSYEAFPQFSSFYEQTDEYKQFNGEARLVSAHGGPFSWVIGGLYSNQRYHLDYREFVPGYPEFAGIYRPDNLEYINIVRTRTKEKAVYGEGTFHFSDKLQVTGGLRYFKYRAFAQGGSDTPLFSLLTPYPLAVLDPSVTRSGGTSADGFVWKLNSSYKVSSDLLVYATYSTGYRTGNVNRTAPCPFTPATKPPGQSICAYPNELAYTPDKTRNAEVGIRASLFDKRVQMTLTAFHVDWNNVQVSSVTENGAASITINAKDAVSKGFDFSGQFRVTPRLTLQATYSYVDAHLTEGAQRTVFVVSQKTGYDVFAGDRLPGSTKHSGSAQVSYVYPLGAGRDIEANWAATYTGNIYSRIGLRGFGEIIPDYVTHRSSVTYHSGKFDIGLFADNIFDKYAVTAVTRDRSSFNLVRAEVPGQGHIERVFAYSVLTPRRIGADVRFHF